MIRAIETFDPNGMLEIEHIMSCQSFDYKIVGDGQIVCISDHKIYRTEIAENTKVIGPFCRSITFPYITYHNKIIPSGKAQNGAAFAINQIDGELDEIQLITGQKIPQFMYKGMLKESFKKFLANTDCTYGNKTVSECNSLNCSTPKPAIIESCCFVGMNQHDYGCE